MRLALIVVWLVLGAYGSAANAQAQPEQEPTPQTTPEPAAPSEPAAAPDPAEPTLPPGVLPAQPADVIRLSLGDAIALGIENNTDVQLVRYDPPIAEYEHTAAWGVHEPTLYSDYTYQSTNLPVASTFFPSQFIERESSGDAGLRGLVPKLGWIYDVGYDASGLQTNSRIQTLATTYTSSLTASLTAPLLKGAWWGSAWTQVQLSGISSQLALEEFRERLMNIVASIEDGYWNLAATRQDLEVANKSLETSRSLLVQTQAQYDVGVVSRVEVTEAEAGVADREFDHIRSLNFYRAAQDELIDRVYGPRLTPTAELAVEPTDRPEQYVSFALDAERSTQRAFERRPELTIARQRVDQSEVLLKFAKNERLPQVDLVGSYGTHGLSGNDPNCPFSQIDPTTGLCLIVPTQPRNIGTDFHDNQKFFFDGNDNRIWLGGAVFSIPLGNSTARANVRIGELELRKALTNVRRVEQDIVKDVRAAVRNLASALEGVEAAERRVVASREQLRAERIRFEHGESTPFDVLQREEDLAEAEGQRIAALRVYHGSVTALDRAQGTLLEDRGIVLEDALGLR
jgi:outer membrane protein TolC